MEPNRSLASLSALACGLAGYYVAATRGHPYDVFWIKGREDRVVRDSIFQGTALSAPLAMLLIQGAMTVVADRPNRRAEGILGGMSRSIDSSSVRLAVLVHPGTSGARNFEAALDVYGLERDQALVARMRWEAGG